MGYEELIQLMLDSEQYGEELTILAKASINIEDNDDFIEDSLKRIAKANEFDYEAAYSDFEYIKKSLERRNGEDIDD